MPKTLLLFLLVVPYGVLAAQQETTATNAPAGPTVIRGCLQSFAREYWLVDEAGQSLQLQYQANKLIHYVGQQVEVTGKPGIETIGTTVDGLASSADEIQVFDVSAVKGAGSSCAANTRN